MVQFEGMHGGWGGCIQQFIKFKRDYRLPSWLKKYSDFFWFRNNQLQTSLEEVWSSLRGCMEVEEAEFYNSSNSSVITLSLLIGNYSDFFWFQNNQMQTSLKEISSAEGRRQGGRARCLVSSFVRIYWISLYPNRNNLYFFCGLGFKWVESQV